MVHLASHFRLAGTLEISPAPDLKSDFERLLAQKKNQSDPHDDHRKGRFSAGTLTCCLPERCDHTMLLQHAKRIIYLRIFKDLSIADFSSQEHTPTRH